MMYLGPGDTHTHDCAQKDGHGLLTEREMRCAYYHTFLCEYGGPIEEAAEEFDRDFLGCYSDVAAFVGEFFKSTLNSAGLPPVWATLVDPSGFEGVSDTWHTGRIVWSIDTSDGALMFRGPNWKGKAKTFA